MISNTELWAKGIRILAQHLGDVEAERFVALIQREPFDYTKWRQSFGGDGTVDEISRDAMTMRKKAAKQVLHVDYRA